MNIIAEQVAFAEMAAREIDEMAKQILDPPHMRRRFESMARGIRFVIENFRTAEEAIADLESSEDFATIEQLRDAVKAKRLRELSQDLLTVTNPLVAHSDMEIYEARKALQDFLDSQ